MTSKLHWTDSFTGDWYLVDEDGWGLVYVTEEGELSVFYNGWIATDYKCEDLRSMMDDISKAFGLS